MKLNPSIIRQKRQDKRTGILLILALLGCLGCHVDGDAAPGDPRGRDLGDFLGSPARLVWVQDGGDNKDVFAQGDQLRLMGLDTGDGLGERVILAGPGNFYRPIISPDGSQVVFSDQQAHQAEVVDWSGKNRRRLGPGVAVAVWRDPETGTDWVVLGRDPVEGGGPTFQRLVRITLNSPHREEALWDQSLVGADNVQFSADGRLASAVMPWPTCGMLDFAAGEPVTLGKGCWPSLAPDNSYRFWFFDGAHRNLDLIETRNGIRHRIALADAPGIGGHEVYHPRWSRHPRYMVMTGPYTIRQGGNNIRGGGEGIEIHVGRFAPDYTGVEAWFQATDNRRLDVYPDLWVATIPELAGGMPDRIEPAGPAPVATARASVRVRATLTKATPIPSPEDIAPYRQGLVANAYQVAEVVEGTLDDSEILAAHWVIRDGALLPDAARTVGQVYTLDLVPYDLVPELEGERLAMDGDDLLLPLFYDRTAP